MVEHAETIHPYEPLSAELEHQIDAALEYARTAPPLPAANRVTFLREPRLLLLELKSGRRLAIPVEDVQDLADATDEQLSKFELEGSGGSIHFPLFDGNLYVPALVEGIRGSRTWMEHLQEKHGTILLAA